MEENYKEKNHNTILKQAVRKMLKPEGLLQKESSRIWVDDNGWFLTVVELSHYDGDGHENLEEELQQIFLLSDEPQKLHAYIVEKIAAQRAYLLAKQTWFETLGSSSGIWLILDRKFSVIDSTTRTS